MSKTIIILIIIAVVGIGGWLLISNASNSSADNQLPANNLNARLNNQNQNINDGILSDAPNANLNQINSGNSNTNTNANTNGNLNINANINVNQAEEKKFTIEASNYQFSVTEIRVKLNDKVKITLNNIDGFHDWKIDEFNAATKQISAGQQDSVEFIASQKGQFEYYCSVGQHRQMGMKGTLIVE